jgi:hypothetical protein
MDNSFVSLFYSINNLLDELINYSGKQVKGISVSSILVSSILVSSISF